MDLCIRKFLIKSPFHHNLMLSQMGQFLQCFRVDRESSLCSWYQTQENINDEKKSESLTIRDAKVRFRTGPKTPEPLNRTEVQFRFRFGPGPQVCGPVLVHRLGEFFEPGLNLNRVVFHCMICIYNVFKF